MGGSRVVNPYTITADTNHADVGYFAGWSIRETAAAAAVVNFRNNAVGGEILAVLELAADTSDTVEFNRHIRTDGVYVEVVSGAVEGVLYSG